MLQDHNLLQVPQQLLLSTRVLFKLCSVPTVKFLIRVCSLQFYFQLLPFKSKIVGVTSTKSGHSSIQGQWLILYRNLSSIVLVCGARVRPYLLKSLTINVQFQIIFEVSTFDFHPIILSKVCSNQPKVHLSKTDWSHTERFF